MAERYQRQIAERGAPSAYLRNHVTPDSAGAGVASALGQMGNAMDRAAIAAQAFNDKQDEIDLMAAANDYNRRMNAYLNDPENGQLVKRKLKDARGLLMDTEIHADELVKDITSRLGEKAADRFRTFEGRLRQPYTNRSSTYEAAQRAEYGKVQAESTLQGFVQSVQADPMNAEMLETAIDAGVLIIEQQMQGAPREAKVNALKAWASQLETARIGIVIGENPMLADRMIQASQYLMPETKAALTAKAKPEVERVQNQGILDQIVASGGLENPSATIEMIRQNYEGAQEESLVSGFKTRLGEKEYAEKELAIQNAKRFEESANTLFSEYQYGRRPIPHEVLTDMLQKGDIDVKMYNGYMSYNESVTDINNQEKRVRAEHPDWSWEQVQAQARNNLGISDRQRTDVINTHLMDIMLGSSTESDLKNSHAYGYLTDNQYERLSAWRTEYNAESGKALRNATNGFIKHITDLSAQGLGQEAQQAAYAYYSQAIANLTPEARADLNKSLQNIAVNALVEASNVQVKTSGRNKKLDTAFNEAITFTETNAPSSYEFTRENAKTFAPQQSASVIDMSNSILYQNSAKYVGKSYKLGGKALGKDGLDCSGLITNVVPEMMKEVNQKAGNEVYSADTIKMMSSGQSADIVENVHKKTGQMRFNPPLSTYREGMIIGLDASGNLAGGRGYMGIDHVSIVVRDNTGKLKVFESNSKQGVVLTDLDSYIGRYKKIYVVDPLMMQSAAATPSAKAKVPIANTMGSYAGILDPEEHARIKGTQLNTATISAPRAAKTPQDEYTSTLGWPSN